MVLWCVWETGNTVQYITLVNMLKEEEEEEGSLEEEGPLYHLVI